MYGVVRGEHTFFARGVQVDGLEEVVHVGCRACALHMFVVDDVCHYNTEIVALVLVVARAPRVQVHLP